MTRMQRVLVAVAALGLLVVFVLPLWRIDLAAPQYPEGLGMVIRINTVQGARPSDLQNLNELNHYIGMRVIDPHAIPEMQWMPWVVIALAAAGVFAAAWGRPAYIAAWIGGCAAAAAAGMIDFYKWEYDYGHHLDLTRAIIKVPGMSYQPPLLGSRQLLNFTATSYPASGTWVVSALLLFVIGVLIASRHRRKSGSPLRPMRVETVGLGRHPTMTAA
jgi:copper chaperone NosL